MKNPLIANTRHSLIKFIVTSILSLSMVPAWGNTPSVEIAFSTCMTAAINHEKQQESPNANHALQACQAELNDLLATMPSQMRTPAKEKITHMTAHKLEE